PVSIFDDESLVVDLTEDDDAVNGMRKDTPPRHMRTPSATRTPQQYKHHAEAMRKKFPEGWNPPRKLSREAM
ncbi:hypothetical protein FISHEDRAFT_17362, partial [Fistulina hepatica ATCC 64428]